MKLEIRSVDLDKIGYSPLDDNHALGKVLLLTDENGELLPGQTDVKFEQPFDGFPRITVTFLVDGERVKLVGSH